MNAFTIWENLRKTTPSYVRFSSNQPFKNATILLSTIDNKLTLALEKQSCRAVKACYNLLKFDSSSDIKL